MRIRKGDVVGRKSYEKDVFFIVDKILKNRKSKDIVMLKGLNIRIMADSPIEDLELISREEVLNNIRLSQLYLQRRIEKKRVNNKLLRQKIYKGKILHLDGDRKYSEKSRRYYNKIGLNAIVKNIEENRQANLVIPLLNKYNPDILIITGHDAMLKRGSNYNNIYNYRNSRTFYKYGKGSKKMGKKFR